MRMILGHTATLFIFLMVIYFTIRINGYGLIPVLHSLFGPIGCFS